MGNWIIRILILSLFGSLAFKIYQAIHLHKELIEEGMDEK